MTEYHPNLYKENKCCSKVYDCMPILISNFFYIYWVNYFKMYSAINKLQFYVSIVL